MGLIDNDLRKKHVLEERKQWFADFVREQKATGSPGMAKACLYSTGHRDSYGKVVFAFGMHKSLWILPAGDNPKALLYPDKAEAKKYAKELQGILRANGYPGSKAWAEQVAVLSSSPHPYSKAIAPTISIEPADRFIIQMIVK